MNQRFAAYIAEALSIIGLILITATAWIVVFFSLHPGAR